ncbi:UPF0187 protein YneE [Smittium mucronatum]|uniref:UPF0187 protein YneE n=1 Tax=Smittium mucronatum TaxID=133383 RepID=A0A1R0H5F4_9FUNG|nr:UPF0187 protein YneE [Smittium mucronatum]
MHGYLISISVQILITFVLIGTLSIAEEIEDPFGTDENDLPIFRYCEGIMKELDLVGIKFDRKSLVTII